MERDISGHMRSLMNLIISPLHAISLIMRFIIRILLLLIFVVIIAFAGFMIVKGSQSMGVVGADSNSQSAEIRDMNYWEYMANRLAASHETPVNCHRTRLVYLAIAIPVYPTVYTYVALFPESSLANHTQPSPLIPDPITWKEAPETWWQLVKEVSWMAFTEPQWDYTPAVGQRLKIDQRCNITQLSPNLNR